MVDPSSCQLVVIIGPPSAMVTWSFPSTSANSTLISSERALAICDIVSLDRLSAVNQNSQLDGGWTARIAGPALALRPVYRTSSTHEDHGFSGNINGNVPLVMG